MRTILEFLNTQEYMCEHLLLKGGTAINLTVFPMLQDSVTAWTHSTITT